MIEKNKNNQSHRSFSTTILKIPIEESKKSLFLIKYISKKLSVLPFNTLTANLKLFYSAKQATIGAEHSPFWTKGKQSKTQSFTTSLTSKHTLRAYFTPLTRQLQTSFRRNLQNKQKRNDIKDKMEIFITSVWWRSKPQTTSLCGDNKWSISKTTKSSTLFMTK